MKINVCFWILGSPQVALQLDLVQDMSFTVCDTLDLVIEYTWLLVLVSQADAL